MRRSSALFRDQASSVLPDPPRILDPLRRVEPARDVTEAWRPLPANVLPRSQNVPCHEANEPRMNFTRSALSFLLLSSTSLLLAHDASADVVTHIGSRSPGTVSVTHAGNVYTLRFTGDEVVEYRIDLDQSGATAGRARVYEASSDSWPMWDTNLGYRDGGNNLHSVGWLTSFASLTGQSMTANSVVLDFTDNFTPIGEGIRHRRTTFTLQGKTLAVRFQDMDNSTSYLRNYIGVLQSSAQSMESPQVLRLPDAVSQPIIRFKDPAGHSWYFNSALDFFSTNAADYFQTQTPGNPTPATTALNYTYNTWGMYKPLSGSTQIGAPVDDLFRVTVSSKIRDTFVTTQAVASPYRSLLEDRIVLMLGSHTWSSFTSFWNQLDQWGLDNIAAYCFAEWSAAGADGTSQNNLGPDWWPPVDPSGFTTMMQQGHAKGFLIGAYTTFSLMPPTSPVYNPNEIAHDQNGTAKTSPWDGLSLIATTAAGLHAATETALLHNNVGANLGYLDVQSYASPTRASDGDHMDQTLGSPWAKTLRQACTDQRGWMRTMQENYQGPILGEGSITDPGSNYEYLWAGFVDSTQRVINTGTLQDPASIPNTRRGWARTVTGWPIIPDIDWYVYSPLQVNHGNGFNERFFSPSDGQDIVHPDGSVIYPMTEPALDRYRIYELTYGHSGFSVTTGIPNGIGNNTYHADLIKEYCMTNALQSRYMQAPPTVIEYLNGGQMKSFQTILEQTGGLDALRDARMHLAFANGLEMWLNHSTSNWNVTVGGTAYTLPQDGFVGVQPATGLVAFSAIAPGTGGNRIDYCLDPAQYEFFDGRGAVSSYGGQSTPFSNVSFTSFSRGRNFRENASHVIQQNGTTNAPALQRVEIVPANSTLAAGSRKGLKAFAVYANGAHRDVTKIVTWSTQSPAVATVNNGAAVTAVAPGTTTVTVSSFQGATVVPASVTVQ